MLALTDWAARVLTGRLGCRLQQRKSEVEAELAAMHGRHNEAERLKVQLRSLKQQVMDLDPLIDVTVKSADSSVESIQVMVSQVRPFQHSGSQLLRCAHAG